MNSEIKTPVIVGRSYENLSEQQLQLSASADVGALLLDGLGDGIFIYAENSASDQMINSLAFGILQINLSISPFLFFFIFMIGTFFNTLQH